MFRVRPTTCRLTLGMRKSPCVRSLKNIRTRDSKCGKAEACRRVRQQAWALGLAARPDPESDAPEMDL